ncbi:MAG: GNAT family N-acetyltransferase [Bacteroidota bacterium]
MHSAHFFYTRAGLNDFPLYFRLTGHPEVMRFVSGRPLTRREAQKRFETTIGVPGPEGCGLYFARVTGTEELAGLAKLIMTGEGTAELGYSLFPAFWGRGYGSEICGFLADLARSIGEIHTLVAITDPENVPSERILEKSGFRPVFTGVIDGLPGREWKLELKPA